MGLIDRAKRWLGPIRSRPWAEEGRNCWRTVRADRLAFLVDGEAYFSALADAFERAEHSILVLGWDVDSQVALRRDDRAGELPVELGPLLDALVRRRHSLRVHVLDWDWPVFYALERELVPRLRWHGMTHENVRFALDANHPVGASHHQKVVVVDDRVAFLGGFDLTRCRWDTPEHRADDPRRVGPDGAPYAPFHDVQVAVAGPAAEALGELARERWRRATGETLEPPPDRGSSPWPPTLEADLEAVEVSLARTEPELESRPAIREVERLHLDVLTSSERWIYIENQYFTSRRIADAIAERLRDEDAPEIVLVTPSRCSGWLEEAAMGSLRARLVRELAEADRHGKLAVYVPVADQLGERLLNVHSKVVIADGRFARVGSANLSNRSMGFDTECDLAVEASRGRDRRVIDGLRDRLLAEHLGTSRERVAAAIAATGSLIGGIESLRGGGRTLERFDPEAPWLADLLGDTHPLDPERPISAEAWLTSFALSGGPS